MTGVELFILWANALVLVLGIIRSHRETTEKQTRAIVAAILEAQSTHWPR
jgi:hypothetical protein